MKDEQAAGGSSETVFVLGALGGIGGQVYARSLEQGFVTRGFDDARLGSGDGTIRPIDARDLSSLDQLVSDMSTSPGAHDLVVLNCVGVPAVDTLQDSGPLSASSSFHINYSFPEELTRRCLDLALASNRSVRLVHIASLAASVGVPQRYSYSVAKAALEGLCRQVASDVDASRFAVAAVSPALVNTSFADPVLTESQRADMAARRASAMSAHALAGLLLWLGLEGLPTLSGSCLRLQ